MRFHVLRPFRRGRFAAAVALLLVCPQIADAGPGTDLGTDDAASGCDAAIVRAVEALVWCDCQAAGLTIKTLARTLAPILWFSPNEPLAPAARDGSRAWRIPSAMPIDSEGSRPVVYYQLEAVHRTEPIPGESCSEPPGDADLRRLGSATITYFLYFPWDRGLNSHIHDLEKLQVEVKVRPLTTPADSCYRVSAHRAIGFGHGLNWFANRLRFPEGPENVWDYAYLHDKGFLADAHASHDARETLTVMSHDMMREKLFPLTFLVEEGKHGVCPDRNGDGVYTPGYDVNQFVNDAWGLRDSLGSGHLGSEYRAEMTKVRHPGQRIFPSFDRIDPVRADAVRGGYRCVSRFDWLAQQEYELRPVVPGLCTPSTDDPHASALTGLCQEHHFSRRPRTHLWPLHWDVIVEGVSLGLLYDDGASGTFSVGLWNVPIIDGWLVVRGVRRLQRGASPSRADLLYTPSASRVLDWYIVVASTASPWIATEGGFKARVTTRNIKLLGRRLRFPAFMGVRMGLRSTPACETPDAACNAADGSALGRRNFRLVFEVGGGAW